MGLHIQAPFTHSPHPNCIKHIAVQFSGLQLPPDELLLDELELDELLDELDVPPLDELDVPPPVELLDELDVPADPEDEEPDVTIPLEDELVFPPPSPAAVSNSESVPTAQLHIQSAGRTKARARAQSWFRMMLLKTKAGIVSNWWGPRSPIA